MPAPTSGLPRSPNDSVVLMRPPSGVNPGICVRRAGALPSLSLPFPSFFHSPLEVGPLKPASWSGRALSPAGSAAEPQPKTNLVHSKSLKLPKSHWWQSFWIFRVPCLRVWRDKDGDGVSVTQYTVVTYEEYHESVSPSPKEGEGRSRFAPSKSSTAHHLVRFLPPQLLNSKRQSSR